MGFRQSAPGLLDHQQQDKRDLKSFDAKKKVFECDSTYFICFTKTVKLKFKC